MKIIKQSQEILPSGLGLVNQIENAGRLAYKSENKITEKSAENFVSKLIKRGHWPALDMGCIHLQFLLTDKELREFYTHQNWGDGKYLFFDSLYKDDLKHVCLLSGSPRALTEYINKRSNTYTNFFQLSCFLYELDPICFSGLSRTHGAPPARTKINCISVDTLDNTYKMASITTDVYKRHRHLGVKFITNRSTSHELVRHRPCGFLQESQRFCRYNQDKFGNEVTFITPTAFFLEDSNEYKEWKDQMSIAEASYLRLLDHGASPQAARIVLPNSCKTEIIVFTNLKEWEHIFRLRTSKAAEPSMREAMIPVCNTFLSQFPCIDIITKPYV